MFLPPSFGIRVCTNEAVGFSFFRSRKAPFEGAATVKPPALPEDTYWDGSWLCTRVTVYLLHMDANYKFVLFVDLPQPVRDSYLIAFVQDGSSAQLRAFRRGRGADFDSTGVLWGPKSSLLEWGPEIVMGSISC